MLSFIKVFLQRIDSMFTRSNQSGWSSDRFWFHAAYATVTYTIVKMTDSVAAHPTTELIYAMCVLILIYLAIVAGSKLGGKILFLIAQLRIGTPDASQNKNGVAQGQGTNQVQSASQDNKGAGH